MNALPPDNILALISAERLYTQYSFAEYIAYCESIRCLFESWGVDRASADPLTVRFFEKKFIEEMEVLAKICKHQDKQGAVIATVQYMRDDPPDGILTMQSGDQIFVECTSARDSRWENFALEQREKHGKIFSLSGYEGADLSGSRASGYLLEEMKIADMGQEPYFVKADEQQDVIARHRNHIACAIVKKLAKTWHPGTNWLSIFVNEFVMPGGNYGCMQSTLNDLCQQFKERLRAKHIKALYFVSNRGDDEAWISFHPMA